MKDLVEKYLKQRQYHDKAERKSRFWWKKSEKTLNDIEFQLEKEDLLKEGNIIDVGSGMVIEVLDCVGFWSPCIKIKEKETLEG